jgi:hypothetical protein
VFGLLGILDQKETSSSTSTTTQLLVNYALDLPGVHAATLRAVSGDGLPFMDRWRFELTVRQSLALSDMRDHVTIKLPEGLKATCDQYAQPSTISEADIKKWYASLENKRKAP